MTCRNAGPFISLLKALLCLLVLFFLPRLTVQAEERLKVMATVPPLYYFTVNVAGHRADVELLLPSQLSPHDFAATPRDLRRLSQARLLFVNGLSLEGWLEGLLRNSGLSPDQVVDTSLGVEPLKDGAIRKDRAKSGPRGQDPHIWLDPLRALRQAANIRDALSRADPGGQGTYQRNFESYAGRLRLLDEEIRSSLKDVKTRYYVAFHDAFAYFAERYGLTLLAAIEEVPGRDPSPRHLARVSDLIRAHGVRSLFSPAGPLPRIVRSLAEDLGLKVYPLDPIEAGPLHPKGYERLMRGNLRLIVEALNR